MQSLWMVAAALAFSTMGAAIKFASARYGTFEIVFWRGLVSAALLYGFVRLRGLDVSNRRMWLHASRSVVGTIAMFCWFFAIARLPLGTAITLNYTSPLFIALVVAATVWWQGGAQSARGWLYAAIAAGFVGVLMILQPTVERDSGLALSVGLAGGFLGALAYLQVKYLGKLGEPEWRVVFWFALINCAMGATAATAFGGWSAVRAADLPLLMGIGALATTGQLCMTRAFGRGRTLLSANLQYTGVIFAAAIGWLAFGETLEPLEFAGIALIVASGVTATLASAERPAPAPAEDEVAGAAAGPDAAEVAGCLAGAEAGERPQPPLRTGEQA